LKWKRISPISSHPDPLSHDATSHQSHQPRSTARSLFTVRFPPCNPQDSVIYIALSTLLNQHSRFSAPRRRFYFTSGGAEQPNTYKAAGQTRQKMNQTLDATQQVFGQGIYVVSRIMADISHVNPQDSVIYIAKSRLKIFWRWFSGRWQASDFYTIQLSTTKPPASGAAGFYLFYCIRN
jgi:hypothetical protein